MIRRQPPAAVLMTGYSSQETTRSARDLGAYDCLSKPFRLTDVERVLGKALSGATEEEDLPKDEGLRKDS